MVTRVRIEAEGRTPADVEAVLYAAHETLAQAAGPVAREVMFGPEAEGLGDAQCGELVIERFARDLKGEPGHGALFFRGRMTTHFAAATPTLDLRKRQPGAESAPYAETCEA